MKTTHTPHDAIFKTFLARLETARDFITLHLPPALLDSCDLTTLRQESGSFVEESLRPYFSDVCYSLKAQRGDGYLYVLIEHQSSPDRLMAFRLMRYAIAVMQRHLDAGHKDLPLVIPILFYHGRRSPWPYSMSWPGLFNEPETAAAVYSSPFPLVDVTLIPDEEIMRHRHMAALTFVQKHIRLRNLDEKLHQIALLLDDEFLTGQQRHALVNYLAQTGETADAATFIVKLAQHTPQHKDELMTIAQQLEQIGREKGLQEGLREASLKIARNLLDNGMDVLTVMKMTGLTEEEINQLDRR